MTDEQQIEAGVSPDLVRISVGLEDVDDICWDLDRALRRATTGVSALDQTVGAS
jgi:O-acetylhomoserine (thiol)-lyase